MSETETFYEVLSVEPDASRETIMQAYREMVKEHHPDVSEHPNARERFKRITRAKTVLTDRAERRRYDRLGHETYLARDRSGQTTGAAADDVETEPTRPPSPGTAAGQQDETTQAGSGAAGASTTERSASADSRQGTAPHGEPMSESTTSVPTDSDRDTGRLGRFALREAVAAVTIGLAAAAGLALSLIPRSVVVSVGVLLASWVIVSAVAGRLAAGSVPTLPDDVVRAQAFPLLLLVVAWYVGTGTDYLLLAGVLAAYGLFSALFRTVALVSRGETSPLWPAGLWFVATAPAAVVAYGTLTEFGGLLSVLTVERLPSVPGAAGGEAMLAVLAAAAVVVGHALWRFGRAVA